MSVRDQKSLQKNLGAYRDSQRALYGAIESQSQGWRTSRAPKRF